MTLTQMYKRIYATIGSDTGRKRQYVTDEDILELLNGGLRMLCLVGKCYNKQYSRTLVVGQTNYYLGIEVPDIIDVYNVTWKGTDFTDVSLNKIELQQVGKIFSLVGDPMWWFYNAKTVTILPAVTVAGDSFRVWYHALDVDLTTGTQSPLIVEHLHGAIVDFALAQIYMRLGVLSLAQLYAGNFSAVSGISLGLINDKLGIKGQSTQPQGA